MNKAEFIAAVSDAAGLTKVEGGRAVEAIIETVKKALKKGDTISLVGFGTFIVRKRAARTGRNPRTGAQIKIKASKNPSFKAGKALKDAINYCAFARTHRAMLDVVGVLSSAVERRPYKARVGGSKPSAPTRLDVGVPLVAVHQHQTRQGIPGRVCKKSAEW